MASLDKVVTLKNAWPEFFGQPTSLAVEVLSRDPTVGEVRVQKPSPPEETPPFDGGKPEDVWVYDDGESNVLGIPQRGEWHFNRRSPGWPELVGVHYKTAVDTIISEQFGVKVVYGPEGFPRTLDLDLYRVFVDVDKAGNVALVPHFG